MTPPRAAAEDREAAFGVPRALYSREAIRIAAHVFEPRADVRVEEREDSFAVTLTPKRRPRPSAAELADLAGEFRNELLNQEYRFLVAGFNAPIAELIETQTLYYARGGARKTRRPRAKSRAFRAEAARLAREAREELRRTRPKRPAPSP